jgi:hypothetical protein
VSTRKLVSTAAEQELLEELIDRAKPPDRAAGRTHYLLSTPFRYPPLRHGSRFGSRFEPGIWYGSETRATAFAEVAYYRLVFLEGTRADLGVVTTQLTVFTVQARSKLGVDLTRAPFEKSKKVIASPTSYGETQALGTAMRAAGVQLIRYPSARDLGGVNVAAFTPAVFGRARPRALETWHCTATRSDVEFAKRDYFGRETLAFARSDFLVHGVLPAPSV